MARTVTPPAAPLKRTALVFLSGLGDWAFDTEPVHVVAQAVQIELERLAEARREFGVETNKRVETVSFRGGGRGRTVDVASVLEKGDRGNAAVVDVYFLGTGGLIADAFESQSFFTKTIAYPLVYGWSYAVLTVFRTTGRLYRWATRGRRGARRAVKPWSDPLGWRTTLQNVWAFVMQSLVLVYSAIAGLTLASIWVDGLGATVERTMGTITAALTAAGFGKFGNVQNLPSAIAATSARHMAAKDYVDGSRIRSDLLGLLADVLDHIGEKPEPYEQTVVVGYSFGAVLALDSIFPKSGEPPNPKLGEIDLLVTVGCPADFIRKQVPDYFYERGCPDPAVEWINVYRPLDVLSSNFRADATPGLEAEEGIHRKGAPEGEPPIRPANVVYAMPGNLKYGWRRAFALEGLRLHARYFRPVRSGAETPLERPVRVLFGDAAGPERKGASGSYATSTKSLRE